MSIDPTGEPPIRRIGSSVALVRRKRTGVRASASAKAIFGILFSQQIEEIAAWRWTQTSLVDVEDSRRWLEIYGIQDGLELTRDR